MTTLAPAGRLVLCLLPIMAAGCSSDRKPPPAPAVERTAKPIPKGPERIVLLEQPVRLQDEEEPFKTSVELTFDLPSRPRRARLKLRYSGVPGATSEDYTMGRFRHKVELNDRYLMDLNTHSEGEDQVVEHTEWISVGMLRGHNKLRFIAGDDGNREGRPDRDEYQLRAAVLEFDW